METKWNGKWMKNEWKMDQKCQLWTTLICYSFHFQHSAMFYFHFRTFPFRYYSFMTSLFFWYHSESSVFWPVSPVLVPSIEVFTVPHIVRPDSGGLRRIPDRTVVQKIVKFHNWNWYSFPETVRWPFQRLSGRTMKSAGQSIGIVCGQSIWTVHQTAHWNSPADNCRKESDFSYYYYY